MPKDFVEHGLNIIVKRLTGISHFFSKHEMDCNAMGIYFGDKSDKGVQRQRIRAEKKVNIFSIKFIENRKFSLGTSTFDYLCCINESTSISKNSLETFV
jgi:hypothetical protein